VPVAFRSAGTFVFGGTFDDVTPGLPAGWQQGDIFILFVEDEFGGNSRTQAGWTAIYTDDETPGHVFWRRAGADETAPLVAGDGSDHTSAQILAFSGCVDTGSPIDAGTFGATTDDSSSSFAVTGGSTGYANEMIVAAVFAAIDATGARVSGWTNASLTGVTELTDNFTTQGSGGGFAVATGARSTIGASGTTSGSLSGGSQWLAVQFGLIPVVLTTGTGAVAIPAVTGAGAGAIAITGTGASGLGAVIGVGSGLAVSIGMGAATIGAVAGDGGGQVAIAGAGSQAVGAVSGAGAGQLSDPVDINGSGSATIAAMTPAGAGALAIAGEADATIGAVGGAGAGIMPPPAVTPPGRILALPEAGAAGRFLPLPESRQSGRILEF